MFGFLKRKTKLQKLQDEYKELMNLAFISSKTNRRLSDEYISKANEIEKLIIKSRD